ncbi:MAG TPA: hypothetical protein PLQ76_02275 [bacterium]|nr:hypothetical protein [bacterium]
MKLLMAAPFSSRKETINPTGILVALIVFVLASFAVGWMTGIIGDRNPDKPMSAAPRISKENKNIPTAVASSHAPTAPAVKAAEKTPPPPRPRRKVAEKTEPPKRETIKTAPPAPRETVRRVAPRSIAKTAAAAESQLKSPKLNPAHYTDSEKEIIIPPPVEKVDVKSINGKPVAWYSVRVGYTDSKSRADILRDVLREQGYIKAETESDSKGSYYINLGQYLYRYQAEEVSGTVADKTGLTPQIFEKTVAK